MPYSKSTLTYRKRKGSPTRNYERKAKFRQCRKCNEPFDSATGHRSYYGVVFCPKTTTQPLNEWTAQQRAIREEKQNKVRCCVCI
jgi:hypothetical protein